MVSFILGYPYLKKCQELLFFFFFLCVFSRATPVAYGGSQAWDLIGATATSLRHNHSNARSLTRDQTCKLMVPSQIR